MKEDQQRCPSSLELINVKINAKLQTLYLKKSANKNPTAEIFLIPSAHCTVPKFPISPPNNSKVADF